MPTTRRSESKRLATGELLTWVVFERRNPDGEVVDESIGCGRIDGGDALEVEALVHLVFHR